MKKILIIMIICIIIVAVSALFIKNIIDRQSKLIMVTEAGFAPYEFYSDSDIIGVDVEIGRAIAEELGKELVIINTDFDLVLERVKSGKADFAAARIINNRREIKRSRFFNRIFSVKTSNNCEENR